MELEARVARVEIAPGEVVDAWTYNGTLPGPLLRLRVGDRLIVHFRNALPDPATVHWHGIRVPFAMDGVPGYSPPDVVPGGSFTYDFVVPDAGLYWYHPHVMSHAQVGFGLYGALLVEDPREREQVGVADELVLVLSDIAVQPGGTLQAPDAGGDIGMVFGREGTHLLVNGRTAPTLVVRAGARSGGESSTPRRAGTSTSIYTGRSFARSAATADCRSTPSKARRSFSPPASVRTSSLPPVEARREHRPAHGNRKPRIDHAEGDLMGMVEVATDMHAHTGALHEEETDRKAAEGPPDH